MNPTDWFMCVLKEKGDDLVLAWQKQASAGGGNFVCWGMHLAGLLASDKLVAMGTLLLTLHPTLCLQEAVSLACAADLEAAGGEAEPEGKSPREAEGGQLVIAPSVPWYYQVYVLSGRMVRMW